VHLAGFIIGTIFDLLRSNAHWLAIIPSAYVSNFACGYWFRTHWMHVYHLHAYCSIISVIYFIFFDQFCHNLINTWCFISSKLFSYHFETEGTKYRHLWDPGICISGHLIFLSPCMFSYWQKWFIHIFKILWETASKSVTKLVLIDNPFCLIYLCHSTNL